MNPLFKTWYCPWMDQCVSHSFTSSTFSKMFSHSWVCLYNLLFFLLVVTCVEKPGTRLIYWIFCFYQKHLELYINSNITLFILIKHKQDVHQVGGPVLYLNVSPRLDSGLQDFSGQMFRVLLLRALALLLLKRLRNGAVQLMSRLQLRPEVLQKILQSKKTQDWNR